MAENIDNQNLDNQDLENGQDNKDTEPKSYTKEELDALLEKARKEGETNGYVKGKTDTNAKWEKKSAEQTRLAKEEAEKQARFEKMSELEKAQTEANESKAKLQALEDKIALNEQKEETRKLQPTQAATNEPGSVSEPTPSSENTSTPIPGEPNTPDTNNPSNPSSNTPQGEEVVEGPTPVEPQDQTPKVFGGLFLASGNDNPLSPTTTNLLGNKDIINRLEGVLEPSEVFLVRRIFRVLNTYCPDNEHDKTLVNNLQERIVRELLNG